MSSNQTTPRQRFSHDEESHYGGLTRHQLYDAPVPRLNTGGSQRSESFISTTSTPQPPRTPTIKFGSEDLVHKYPTKGLNPGLATHERRETAYRSPSPAHISMLPISEEPSPIQSTTTSRGLGIEQPQPQHATLSFSSASSITDPFTSTDALHSAPASFLGSHRHPNVHDPFGGFPATASGSQFPGRENVESSTVPMTNRSRFSPDNTRDISNRGQALHWPSSSHQQSHSQGQQRQRQRDRTPSDRGYPKGSVADDREESMSLVREPSLDEERSGSPSDEDELQQHGGIRLVESTLSSNRF
jgi:magnesium transporter